MASRLARPTIRVAARRSALGARRTIMSALPVSLVPRWEWLASEHSRDRPNAPAPRAHEGYFEHPQNWLSVFGPFLGCAFDHIRAACLARCSAGAPSR